MSTSITITGTGSPIPDAHRAGPGALVRCDDLMLQFDAGRSTVQRLAGANVWIPDLGAVFITHHHSDHLTGLADVILTYWTMDRSDAGRPLPIIAPAGPASAFVSTLLDGWADDIEVRAAHAGRNNRPQVDVISFEVPDAPTEVWRQAVAGGDIVVSAGPVRHEPCPLAVGYRIDTPDGSIAISGDTRVCDEVAALAEGVDVLVYEAMRFDFYEKMPEPRRYVTDYHADTPLIGAQAAELGVPKVILTHLIPGPASEAEKQLFYDGVRRGGYEGEIVVADDLYTSVVGAGGLPEVEVVVHAEEQ